MIRDDPSRSELIRPGLAVRVDPVRLLYLPLSMGYMSKPMCGPKCYGFGLKKGIDFDMIFELFFCKKNTSYSARRVCYGRVNG